MWKNKGAQVNNFMKTKSTSKTKKIKSKNCCACVGKIQNTSLIEV
jgi:hypothetical protein